MLLIGTSTKFTRYMVNCMFSYNIASLMLEILCLKYALNDPLGRRTLRMPWSGKTMLKIGENKILPSVMRMWGWACVHSFDFMYAGLTLHM